jgi:hypothetical protein
MKTILYLFLFYFLLILPGFSSAQFLSVSGYIKNSATDRGILNASIFETDSGIGTISNKNGYYRLLLRPGEQKIIISRTGFESYTTNFVLTKDTVISIDLKGESLPAGKMIVENDKKNSSDSIKVSKSKTEKK